MLSIVIFLSLGYVSGQTFSLFIVPPPLPKLGSQEDEAYLHQLAVEGGQLPIVQELQHHPEDWQELNVAIDSEPLSSKLSGSSSTAFTQLHASKLVRSIKGSFGIGYYRMFWNVKEKRIVTIVHLGVSLSGWPSIVHGGCLATLLLENMESLVFLVRGATGTQSKQINTQQYSYVRGMQLKYKRPTHSERFYIIRTEIDSSSLQHQFTIKTHIEDFHSGLVTAEAVGETVP